MTRLLVAALLCACSFTASARQGVDWDAIPNSPEVKQWYKELMRPDYPQVACCGESDAYWADSFEVDGDNYVAIITDTRADEPLGRPHIEPGTRVIVPNAKLKYDQGNPTGHGVLFVTRDASIIYCYVVPGGA